MKTWKFYHGTSEIAYKTIVDHGFIISELRFHNFLSPQGPYFVPNRPLIARRFAKKASRQDSSMPIVLEVPIRLSKIHSILDLTTDDGMNLFYKTYVEIQKIFSIAKGPKLGENTPSELREYFNSLHEANKETIKKLEEANLAYSSDPVRFNWDTAAIRQIVDEYGIQLIIAAVQEGTTFNASFSRREPEYRGVPSFKGIQNRDHIEVCVTDLSIIDVENIRIRSERRDLIEFDKDFINWITNIDSRD